MTLVTERDLRRHFQEERVKGATEVLEEELWRMGSEDEW